jgi:hypothetical protein
VGRELRLRRALAFARLGSHATAAAEAVELSAPGDTAGTTLYDLACVHALSAAAAGRDAQLSRSDQEQLVERYAARAVELLARAHAAGAFKNPDRSARLKRDSVLDALRPRADFQKLLREIAP